MSRDSCAFFYFLEHFPAQTAGPTTSTTEMEIDNVLKNQGKSEDPRPRPARLLRRSQDPRRSPDGGRRHGGQIDAEKRGAPSSLRGQGRGPCPGHAAQP